MKFNLTKFKETERNLPELLKDSKNLTKLDKIRKIKQNLTKFLKN